ncbi:exportin-1, putative [Plasmodium ovale wallikeri]|uniref:Exportin-1, putative n=2 Tax=Plasmodium ovale TaxID=36330 RepID=A0A1A9ANX6_PLAOA|nr:exportin-1, putative [Plasmodium ovale wallikeri]SBT58375.1 exportin-1, putative [Plasmodium ovale wallikeri]SBT73024.1 exportin-1, putative [Plasmodium ovale]
MMESETFNPLSLLDKNQPFDADKLKLLDSVVEALLDTKDKNRRDFAQNLLNQFKMLDNSWRSVSIILEHSENVNTKFYGLQILEECINNKWNILPSEEREGMKNFIACYTITLSTEGTTVGVDRHLLNKLDETLIQIVKKEWPDSWSSFIPDIVNSAKLNQNVCENNMKLLNMLSEEVFDFGNETLIKKKKEKLRNEYASQFQDVYNLCLYILEANVYNKRSTNTSLIKQTLNCLSNFFKWIPLTYIFDKYKFNDNNIQIIDLLFDHFWDDISYKIECVKCIQEIVMLKIDEKNIIYFDNVFINLWSKLVSKIKMLPNANEMKNIPPELKIFWEQYFLQLSICITSFLRNYREKIVEKNNNTNDVNIVFKFLNMLANSNMEEVFLIIIDYYNIFTEQLIRELITRLEQEQNLKNKNGVNTTSSEMKNTLSNSLINVNLDPSVGNRKSYSFATMVGESSLTMGIGMGNGSANGGGTGTGCIVGSGSGSQININEYSSILDKIDLTQSDIKKMCPRIKLYEFILNDIRKTVIEKMAKPQEIYISYDNETGEVVRDFEPDTTEISLYNTMKTTLVYLTYLGSEKTMELIVELLNKESEKSLKNINKNEIWNSTKTNRISYAVGSISMCMTLKKEQDFLMYILRIYLHMIEVKNGEENRAILASCVMYIVSQYHRFLKLHWRFLKTVMKKLFEFAENEKVQDMAAETILKICKQCKNVIAKNNHSNDSSSNSSGSSCNTNGESFFSTFIKFHNNIMHKLPEKLNLLLYEAIAHVISCFPYEEKQESIKILMSKLMNLWNSLICANNGIKDANVNVAVNVGVMGNGNAGGAGLDDVKSLEHLCTYENSKLIITFVRVNCRLAYALSYFYYEQLNLVFFDFLKIYQLYSKFINLEVETNGTKRIKHAQFRNLFLMKREFLHLIETTIERSCYNIQELEAELLKREQKKMKNEVDESMDVHLPTVEEAKQINFQMTSNILNVLLETILVDYRDSNPHIKDAEVFSLLSTVFKKIENVTCPILPTVLNYVLLPTIDMIKNDFSSYPEHREKFYNFLDACVRHCFDYLFTLDSEIFNTFIQSLLWAIKHEHPSVADHGLRITHQFLHNIIVKKKEYLEEFCKAFYYIILNEVFKTLTDSFHKSGFHYQTIILMNMLRLLEFEVINIPEVEITKPHIIKHVQTFLTQSFDNLNQKQIETFSVDLFNFCVESPPTFRTFVRDLLISLKEFSTNQDELYEADRQEALQRAKLAEDNKLIKLRGLMKEDVPTFSAIDVDDECINVE